MCDLFGSWVVGTPQKRQKSKTSHNMFWSQWGQNWMLTFWLKCKNPKHWGPAGTPLQSVFTYHWMRFSCYQRSRTLLLVFVVGICLGSPLVQVSFRSMEATVYDAGFLLKRFTNPISLIPVAKAWLSCQEICMTFEGFFICLWRNVVWLFLPIIL